MFRWVAGYLVGLLIFGVLFPALLIAAGKLYPVPLFFFPAMGQSSGSSGSYRPRML